MEVKLRKYQYILGTAGFGVLAFSLWSIIKTVIFILLQGQGYLEVSDLSTERAAVLEEEAFDTAAILEEGTIDTASAGLGIEKLIAIVFLVVFGLIILDLCLRIYVGRSARKVSRGRKKGLAYIVIAVILGAFSVFSMITGIMSQSYLRDSYADTVITFLIDLASTSTLIAVIISGIQVRRLTHLVEKQKNEEEAVCR